MMVSDGLVVDFLQREPRAAWQQLERGRCGEHLTTPTLVNVPMRLRDLPDSLTGKKIVQISDLHVGPIVSHEYLRGCMELVSSLEPDFVAVTGDFVSFYGPARIDEAVSLLADMQPGKLATIAVTGNHDFGFSRDGFTESPGG